MLVPLAEIAADRVIAGVRVRDALKRVDAKRHRAPAAALNRPRPPPRKAVLRKTGNADFSPNLGSPTRRGVCQHDG